MFAFVHCFVPSLYDTRFVSYSPNFCYWNYYSVIGNSSATWKYYSAIKMLIYKWLNRRSQRKSYRWEKFKELFIGGWNLPAPRTVEQGEAGLQQQRLALPEVSHAS